MSKIAFTLGGVFLAALPAFAAEPVAKKTTTAPAAAVITPIRLTEDREKDLAKMDLEITGSRQLTLTVRVEGEGFAEARAWGNVRVAEATDDTGRDLRIPRPPKKPLPPDIQQPAQSRRLGRQGITGFAHTVRSGFDQFHGGRAFELLIVEDLSRNPQLHLPEDLRRLQARNGVDQIHGCSIWIIGHQRRSLQKTTASPWPNRV